MKILLLRNMGDQININNYNVQEIGLAKALVKRGHECDIVLYSLYDKFRTEKVYIEDDKYITLYWVKGINIYYNSIFLKLIRNKFFDKYDIIQTHEYNQLMTFILPYITKSKLVIYHGPYQDIRNKAVHGLFDRLFLASIRKNYPYVIAKSVLSQKYLLNKGFKEVNVLGVGLDQNRFKATQTLNGSLSEFYLKCRGNYPVLVYVGSFCRWKNTPFLLEISKELKKKLDFRLLIISNGAGEYKEEFFDKVKELHLENNIHYVEKVNQQEISSIYTNSDLLLLPSIYEIFGMVLLESLYFDCPILTSYNGGSSVLLDKAYPEMIMKDFDAGKWADRIIFLLKNKEKYKLREYVNSYFTWESISEQFENKYLEVIGFNDK